MIIFINLACAALYATLGQWDVVVTCATLAALMWWLERKPRTMKPTNWDDTQTYWMRWVVVTTIAQQIIVGKLIDVSETDDPVLMIDDGEGEGYEIPLSQVASIEHYS